VIESLNISGLLSYTDWIWVCWLRIQPGWTAALQQTPVFSILKSTLLRTSGVLWWSRRVAKMLICRLLVEMVPLASAAGCAGGPTNRRRLPRSGYRGSTEPELRRPSEEEQAKRSKLRGAS
jgi:hypothetical protein